MAEFHLPEFDEAIRRTVATVNDTAADLQDFCAAVERCELPEQILDEYESRKLLRKLSDDANVN